MVSGSDRTWARASTSSGVNSRSRRRAVWKIGMCAKTILRFRCRVGPQALARVHRGDVVQPSAELNSTNGGIRANIAGNRYSPGGDRGHRHTAGADGLAAWPTAWGLPVSRQEHYVLFSVG